MKNFLFTIFLNENSQSLLFMGNDQPQSYRYHIESLFLDILYLIQIQKKGMNIIDFQPAEKSIILTPAIAAFEKIVSELKMLNDEMHPELIRLKQEQEEYKNKKFAILDKYTEHQKKLIKAQYEFEKQQANEEYEDFVYSLNSNK